MNFAGSKVALIHHDKLVVFLRDNKVGINNPGKWDFFGGGREGDETPIECAIREVEEETGITLSLERFKWERVHGALHDSTIPAYFFVAEISNQEVDSLVLTEGQSWEEMSIEDFLNRDAVEGMKNHLREYLAVQGLKQKLADEGFVHIYEWTDAPCTDYPSHAHKGAVSMYILDGGLTFWFGDEIIELKEGDRFDVPVGKEHTAKVGESGCTFLVGEMIEGDS